MTNYFLAIGLCVLAVFNLWLALRDGDISCVTDLANLCVGVYVIMQANATMNKAVRDE